MLIINKISTGMNALQTFLSNSPRIQQYSKATALGLAAIASYACANLKGAENLFTSGTHSDKAKIGDYDPKSLKKSHAKWGLFQLNASITLAIITGIGIGAVFGRKS